MLALGRWKDDRQLIAAMGWRTSVFAVLAYVFFKKMAWGRLGGDLFSALAYAF